MKNYTLYVLRLEEEKYYVGSSSEYEKRVRKHFDGKGSSWTRNYKPLEVLETISLGNCSYRDAEIAENKKVVLLMKSYGWQNVRGGFFSNVDEHSHLGNLTAHSEEYQIDFIPVFKKQKKVLPDPTSISSSCLSEEVLLKRIQGSVAAYFGNKFSQFPASMLCALDCRSLYEDWLERFQARYGQIHLDSEMVVAIFENLRDKRLKKQPNDSLAD